MCGKENLRIGAVGGCADGKAKGDFVRLVFCAIRQGFSTSRSGGASDVPRQSIRSRARLLTKATRKILGSFANFNVGHIHLTMGWEGGSIPRIWKSIYSDQVLADGLSFSSDCRIRIAFDTVSRKDELISMRCFSNQLPTYLSKTHVMYRGPCTFVLSEYGLISC